MSSTTPPACPKPSAAAPQETPKYMSKNDHCYEARMRFMRENIPHVMGPSIPEVSFSYLLSSCLPPVDKETVSTVYDKLKEKKILSAEGWSNLRFDKLKKKGKSEGKSKPVAQSGPTQQQEAADHEGIGEAGLFQPLAGDFNAVLEEVKSQTESVPLLEFSSKAGSKALSEGIHANYKTDLDGLLVNSRAVTKGAADGDYECDLAFIGEYKKDNKAEDRRNNILKILGNANHIMGSDPTRRFMFGMTVENTDTRISIWFFSRSHVFVTQKIDFQKDAKLLVHLIVALGRSDLSELGFDLTVERVNVDSGDQSKAKEGPQVRYRFKIGDNTYGTTETLSDYKAKFLLGRAGRIYKVRLVDQNGLASAVEYVLKDSWIPDDSLTEKETQDHIRGNLNLVNPVQDLSIDEFSEHFIVIKECERVQVRSTRDPRSYVNDSTSNFLREPFPEGLPRYLLRHEDFNYVKVPSKSIATGSKLETVNTSRSFISRSAYGQVEVVAREYYEGKVHCRILMEYAGEPISKVADLKTVMICLGQVVKALEYMYTAGYVHRDISIGNILYSEVDGRIIARLGDLEYAKQVSVPSEPHRDLKTGTPHFIACEVERGRYLFQPQQAFTNVRALMHRVTGNTITTEPNLSTIPFRFHYLHDLESVWWILVFFVFTKIPAGTTLSDKQLKVQHATRKSIFPYPFTSPKRQEFLTDHTDKRDAHMAILVEDFANTCIIVNAMGDFLGTQYGTVEAMPNFPAGDCFSGIHGRVHSEYFGEYPVDLVFNGPLENLPLESESPEGNPPATSASPDENTPATGAKKRKMDETEEIVEGTSRKKGRQGRR